MTWPPRRVERRLRLASVLILLGLGVEIASLGWVHPLAFLAFATVGAVLILAGILYYLLMLVNIGQPGP